ncbi:Sulfoacetaldehyde acetyltransferase [Aliiroseovarius sp. xm-m-379]|uniref:thiamine pyrophosphate-binding protein n=1 Tax=unclassified Aliiroseovarius TaxID=2623558 RepID=UPI001568BCCB|nr:MULTISPECIES: thiamine pyrophosphate-binding protein [unclassified Aliiroseovarius]NRP13084.1 Sulfoacetaldehyde acetyltransferase [Aliiroseovarius sp. xm-d-517]NRP24083.1 Sulfoacetaldehyde acetyltransferase [Aliiroseovarius sp. xm-m-379]NRP30106.1 Sulfoacetaldehyde acetyltransferase [Aliiroseovarius sp. xm-m-314]NRP32882.1 Sulfoacetaldehyde acetyltransferase [Aliiroseovarius sp. xm-a-104]NRP40441.1 Sulfoacetaldehyde acetyltransferase [Aliiroseovarius sp. xm-m-339-2]
MVQKIYAYQSIARALHDHGVKTMFGLMGDANLFMVDSFVRECEGQFVPAAHEGSSVLMALAFAQVAGTVGVATVTHGPALTNCVTALTEGVRGQIPMVLLAGDTPVSNPRHLQSTDQREVVKTTGAGFVQLRAPDTIAADVDRAIYRAQVERRPIVLNMPADFMWQEVEHEQRVLDVFTAPGGVAEGETLDNAIGMVASARRPMILAGAGAIHARDQIIRLADRLEAPVATTLKAKGLFKDHPYNMDIFGTLSTPATYEAIAKADCILCFGTSLHDYTSDRGALMKGKRVVQVDVSPEAIGQSTHPHAALVADAALTAETILYWLNEAEVAPSGFTQSLDPAALTHHPVGPNKTADGCVNFVHALARLEEALPHDRVLVTDGGRFMTEVWCRISAHDPQSFVVTANFGAIGQGLQEAVGAGVAAPDRPVVLFTGDGGFMMGGINEFNTAVRLGLDLIVIVANDSAYGAEHIQFLDRKMDPGLSEFQWPSFAALATALGGRGIEVRSDEELEAAISALETRAGPTLVELRLDPHDVPRMRF